MTDKKTAPSLLDRDIPEDYRKEWTDHVAERVVEAEEATESVVIFRVGAEWLCMSTERFQGIAEVTPIHSLPQRRESIIMGISDVRGELLICVSLATLLGISSDAPAANIQPQSSLSRFMILRGTGGPLAFPVQEVHGIHHYSGNQLKDLPSTLENANVHYTVGVLLWGDRTVARLDDIALFNSIEESLS